jgi:hypothetical protein
MVASGDAYANRERDSKGCGCPRLRAMQPFEDRWAHRRHDGRHGRATLGPDAAVLLEAANGAGDALGFFRAGGACFQVGLNGGGTCAEQEVGELFVCEVVGEVAFH